MAQIYLTHMALRDIREIEEYSVKNWGNKRADKYLVDIQETLQLIADNPKLLKSNSKISNRFKVFHIQRHWLICEIIGSDIYVLTVRHISMNLLDRLKELEPTLEEEANILFNRLKKMK